MNLARAAGTPCAPNVDPQRQQRMIHRKTHLDPLAIGLLVACCAFWGLQQILIKATVAEVPPLWQASVRMAAPWCCCGCGAARAV